MTADAYVLGSRIDRGDPRDERNCGGGGNDRGERRTRPAARGELGDTGDREVVARSEADRDRVGLTVEELAEIGLGLIE